MSHQKHAFFVKQMQPIPSSKFCAIALNCRARTFDGKVTLDMLTTHPGVCRKILSARFVQLNKERIIVEGEGGGSPQGCA